MQLLVWPVCAQQNVYKQVQTNKSSMSVDLYIRCLLGQKPAGPQVDGRCQSMFARSHPAPDRRRCWRIINGLRCSCPGTSVDRPPRTHLPTWERLTGPPWLQPSSSQRSPRWLWGVRVKTIDTAVPSFHPFARLAHIFDWLLLVTEQLIETNCPSLESLPGYDGILWLIVAIGLYTNLT